MRYSPLMGLPAMLFALVAAGFSVVAGQGKAAAQRASLGAEKGTLRADLQRDLDDYLKDRSVVEHLSSLSLTVSLGRGQPSIDVTSGTMTYRGGSRVTPKSLYQIGSNTKAFTALAILELEARGRLSIDAPLGDYLPQYPAYRKLTLRRLLDMTGGLESYDNTPAWEQAYAANPAADVPADRLIRLVYPRIKFVPGSTYHYSNTGYLLAQEVVRTRSESKSFEREIARIIASAGLHDTFYSSNLYPAAIAQRVVAGYYENDDAGFGKFRGRDMSGFSLSWAQGAGAIVSTPSDLATWARAIYQGTSLLPAKQKAEMLSLISTKSAKPLAMPSPGDPAGFGLGVARRFDPKLGTFWFYQGETLGFRAAHLYFPKSDLVVCVFANSRPTEKNSNVQALFGTIYNDIQAFRNRGKRAPRG